MIVEVLTLLTAGVLNLLCLVYIPLAKCKHYNLPKFSYVGPGSAQI